MFIKTVSYAKRTKSALHRKFCFLLVNIRMTLIVHHTYIRPSVYVTMFLIQHFNNLKIKIQSSKKRNEVQII